MTSSLKHHARFTPPTGSRNGTEETLFFRLLDFNPKTLNLSIAKFRWHENRWESSVYTTEIHPYAKKELESALKSVGFAKLDAYRNYNFEDYDPNGSDIILIAQKKGVLKSKNSARREKLVSRPEPAAKPPKKELPSKAVAQPSKAKLVKPVAKPSTKRKK
jgi:hypothetical protein